METCDLCARALMEKERERGEAQGDLLLHAFHGRERAGGTGVLLLHTYARETAEGTGSASCTVRVCCHTLKFSTACTRLFYFPNTCGEKTKHVLASNKWDQES